jgi:hypothetical protein
MTGIQTYSGPWEVEVEVTGVPLAESGDTCVGYVTFVIDFDEDPVTVEGEGDCTFEDDGMVAALMSMGLADSLGPYGGAVDGEMISATMAEGSVPIDITDDIPLEVSWEGELSADGTEFNGDLEGSETVEIELIPGGLTLPATIEYEVTFDTVLE